MAALMTAACGNDPTGYVPLSDSQPTNVLQQDIDTDARLEAAPGEGVGLQVEYAAGGTWTLRTTCDTKSSGYSCDWDIVASVDRKLELGIAAPSSDLEKTDRVLRVDPGAVRLVLSTDADTDTVSLTAPAGEALELNVTWLNGNWFTLDPAVISWVMGGLVQKGAPSDPVDLLPTSP